MSLGYEFAPIDVSITTHPKAFAAGVEAMGLWLWGMAYAKQHRTGGHLHRAAVLGAWGGKRNIMLAKKLVEAGLWIAREDGDWNIHNFERKSAGRRKPSESPGSSTPRVKKHREKQRLAANETDVTDGETVETDPVAGVFPSTSPSISVSSGSDQGGAGGRRALAADEPLTDSLRAAFDALTLTGPPLDADDVWQGFVSHRFRAGTLYPSATAVELDWREWVKRQVKFAAKDRGRGRVDTRQPLNNPEQADWLKASGGDL